MLPSTLLRAAACAALAFAAPAVLAQAAPPLPDGKVGIHYNRCDAKYDNWGVHLWRNPNIPLPGVEWQNPMPPSGKSDFGVYWHVDFDQFGKSGTVNYIIHQGDNKEQGGKDMKFDGKATKEIWVLSGDREIYTSRAAADEARAKTPCK